MKIFVKLPGERLNKQTFGVLLALIPRARLLRLTKGEASLCFSFAAGLLQWTPEVSIFFSRYIVFAHLYFFVNDLRWIIN